MKRFLLIIVAAAFGTFFVQPAAAEDCKFQSFQTTGEFEDVESPDYDLCVTLPVVGTIKGELLSCINFADVFPTDEIWGDDGFRFVAAKWFALFKTNKGEIYANEWGMFDFDTFVQSTIFEITGGTGDYEGATGVLTLSSKWPATKPDVSKLQGEICTP